MVETKNALKVTITHRENPHNKDSSGQKMPMQSRSRSPALGKYVAIICRNVCLDLWIFCFSLFLMKSLVPFLKISNTQLMCHSDLFVCDYLLELFEFLQGEPGNIILRNEYRVAIFSSRG